MFEGGVNKDASVFTSCVKAVKNDENTPELGVVWFVSSCQTACVTDDVIGTASRG